MFVTTLATTVCPEIHATTVLPETLTGCPLTVTLSLKSVPDSDAGDPDSVVLSRFHLPAAASHPCSAVVVFIPNHVVFPAASPGSVTSRIKPPLAWIWIGTPLK